MRYQVSGRTPSIITAALAVMLALGMQLVTPDRAKAGMPDTAMHPGQLR